MTCMARTKARVREAGMTQLTVHLSKRLEGIWCDVLRRELQRIKGLPRRWLRLAFCRPYANPQGASRLLPATATCFVREGGVLWRLQQHFNGPVD